MMTRNRRRVLASVAAFGAAGMVLAGCTGGPGTTEGGGGGEGGDDDNVVTVYGTISGTEAELLEESWAAWEEENDIDIQYEASQEFEAQIAVRAQGGNAPDLAIFPQPGLLADMATRGYLVEAPADVVANAEEYWSPLWQGFGTVDGTVYGAPLMASVKGWVWYSPATFAENGWEVPTTWDGLKELTAQIAAEKGAPWCVGFGSDAATGWPGTDWIEDIVLRQSGPEVYDQWVANEIPFTDPQIKSAFDEVASIILNPEYVNAGYGDVQSIGTTPFGDPATALASGDCTLHHQASFYDGFIVDAGATVAEDGDIWAFQTPPFEESDGGAATITGGGEIVGAFDDSASTQAVQTYLSSPEWANSRVSLGGVISANKGLDPENASSAILTEAIKLLQDDATTFRFDGSDLMPSSVGAGTFWQGMRDWVNGTDTDTILEQIEAGWPSS